MKQSILIFAIVFSFKAGFAQQASPIVKVSFKDKKDPFAELQISGPSLFVEGYDGNDLTIEPYNINFSKDPQAYAWGLTDITSLINRALPVPTERAPIIKEYPQLIQISMSATNHKALLIKVPRNIHLKLFYNVKVRNGKISLKDLSGELEISGISPLVEVDNVSGPLTLSSHSITHSKIKITHVNWDTANIDKLKSVLYPDKQKFLLYLSSPYDDMDISLPDDLKATFSINSTNGDIYSDFDLVKKYPASNNLNAIFGDVNGGGVHIVIFDEYGNIFLRKETKP